MLVNCNGSHIISTNETYIWCKGRLARNTVADIQELINIDSLPSPPLPSPPSRNHGAKDEPLPKLGKLGFWEFHVLCELLANSALTPAFFSNLIVLSSFQWGTTSTVICFTNCKCLWVQGWISHKNQTTYNTKKLKMAGKWPFRVKRKQEWMYSSRQTKSARRLNLSTSMEN